VGTHVDKIHTRAQKLELNQCIKYISNTYGAVDNQWEGFPQVLKSMIVSCKSGRYQKVGGIEDFQAHTHTE